MTSQSSKEIDDMETERSISVSTRRMYVPPYSKSNRIYLAGFEYQTSNSVNLTGNWFVNFGANLPDCNIEGCKFLTINGNFDPDTLMDVLVQNIYKDLPEEGRKMLDKHNKSIIIRAFNRI